MSLVYIVVDTAFLKAISIEGHHLVTTSRNVAGHGGLMFVIGTVRVAGVV